MNQTRSFRGDVLRSLRSERKWSQSQLAGRINAHVTSISDWERGANEPSGRHVASLTREFGVTVDAFYRNAVAEDDEEAALPVEDLARALHRIVQQEVAGLLSLRDEAERVA